MTITLNLPDELVRTADAYAKLQHSSLAGIIEQQLLNLHKETFQEQDDLQSELVDYFGKIPDFDINLSETRTARCLNW
jgi:hypothetical protein